MYRFKQLLAGKVSLRNYNGQAGEVMAYVSHKQTQYPRSACQKAPRVTVTWGWGYG